MPSSRRLISFVYFSLAILGAILPTLSNIEFAQTYGPGFDINKFILLANINPAAESLSRDLMVGASAIIIWIVTEARRLKMKNLWIVLLSTFTIAFAFAAPLFLFLRERRLMELEKEGILVDIRIIDQ
ncbi:DUF2834 domain-containing protein [Prochlorococcus sp. MIT 1307]|uniref:DUF2834 domain-containing protein n=1 Tax=Prochlorococcus sp. MIT 1307 TaxID=3096219 RepID=UPI002A762D7F|nr:DUF2834 domain-containing protein [Prochlorococcus sp. MIT 1307]